MSFSIEKSCLEDSEGDTTEHSANWSRTQLLLDIAASAILLYGCLAEPARKNIVHVKGTDGTCSWANATTAG